ncbi:MAG: glycosyltransferase family 4 protein [Eggerthellaceae bacterium]|nr:glycosyltransferase family 4 protein [Eggerthellaceae bacterium]
MRVLLIRTNGVNPDPRVEKEANTIAFRGGYDLKILAWERFPKKKYEESSLCLPDGKVPIIRLGIPALWGGGIKRNFFPLLKFEIRVLSWLIGNRGSFDVIHACDLQTGIPAAIAKKLHGKRIIYDIYDYYSDTVDVPSIMRRCFKRLEDRIISKADATIICSEQRKEQIKDAKPANLYVVHNSPSAEQLREPTVPESFILKSSSGKTKVAYVGNLVEDRCIKQLLDAVAIADDAELHIGGFGTLEDYVKEFSEYHENVFFYGKMTYAEAIALERSCDIMVALYDPAIRNHKYAAPNKFYEALSLGKPLIMFHGTGMDCVIDEHGIGVTCNPGSAAIADAIANLQSRKSDWEAISTKERNLFEERYSWPTMEKRLLAAYKCVGEMK